MPEHRVTAQTRSLGVVGYPVRHSLSPQLQRILFELLGIDACYHAFEVPEEALEPAIRGAAALGFVGLNVTVPHKERAARLCDDLSAEAQALGVVNTLAFRNGSILGTTTDPIGFLRPLEAQGFELQRKAVAVIGAGGAARAVAYACATAGARVIRIVNRSLHRATALVDTLAPLFPGVLLEAYPMRYEDLDRLLEADLIVNATSVGMWPEHGKSVLPEHVHLPRGALAYDLVYNPVRTLFLRQAERDGAATQGGLDMLIYQALGSLAFWFGREIPEDPDLIREVRHQLEKELPE
ncbi:MAG: shikimate dehydrogenase [candidate division KSB1 bacterium]|nr:shikimate dehydrogenase [candidate division KSB1 bacterium]